MQQLAWQSLSDEISRWNDLGLTPQFWWRDDDASRVGPKLERLAKTSSNIPVCLAVVPDWLDEGLADWLCSDFDKARILQHGWAHKNHAEPAQKKSEFGDNRPLAECLHDIKSGHDLLSKIFKVKYQKVFVAPWNRISGSVIQQLSTTQHTALSLYGARNRQEVGIKRINTHVDIINWRNGRCFIGNDQAIALCVAHLSAKRANSQNLDPTEPTGILTHHIDHDEGCWRFLEELTFFSHNNPSLRWVTPNEVL